MSEPVTEKTFLGRLADNWIAIVLVILAVIFIAQNGNNANLTILWIDVRWPLWLALALLFVVGFAAGYLARGRKYKRKRQAMK